jgi:sortase (surface protein transpeptidase)
MTVRPRGRLLAGLIAVLLILGVVMVAIGNRTPQPPPTSSEVTDLRTGLPVPEPALAEGTPHDPPKASPEPADSVPTLPRSVPLRLDIPAIKVHSRVTSLGLQPDGTVEVPPLTANSPAGWYKYLATPGELGPAVILGHVDSARNGPAVFYRLGELRRGDTVSVTRADGAVATFAVRSVNQVPKSEFPTKAVYGPTSAAELRLVTCGGTFDRSRRSYQDNIIVFASLRSVARRPA